MLTMSDNKTREFMNKFISVDGLNTCWNWIGTVNNWGYGSFFLNKKRYSAHRVSYELLYKDIPPKLQLDHLCRNRRCINPLHLEPVTAKVNVARGMGPGGINSRKTHCINGHEFTKENTYKQPKGRGCYKCQADSVRRYKLRKVGFDVSKVPRTQLD